MDGLCKKLGFGIGFEYCNNAKHDRNTTSESLSKVITSKVPVCQCMQQQSYATIVGAHTALSTVLSIINILFLNIYIKYLQQEVYGQF